MTTIHGGKLRRLGRVLKTPKKSRAGEARLEVQGGNAPKGNPT
jgi:hypothetical protein